MFFIMLIAIDAFPIILMLAFPLALSLVFQLFHVAVLLLLLIGGVCYFFRDPNREIKAGANMILAPADGTILEINETLFDGKNCTHAVIFMSVLNVHINRIPFSGKVLEMKYFAGKFLRADQKDILKEDERMEVTLETLQGKMKFIQVAGFIARKIVCRLKENQVVTTGEKFGLIKFGSRMDVIFPNTAKCLVKIGDKTIGGITPLAQF